MSDLFFNKIAAAVLASALGFIGINKIASAMVHSTPNSAESFAYLPEMEPVNAGGETAAPEPFPQAEWLANMDAVRGAKVFAKCKSCHTVSPDGKNGTGPGLYGVVGRAAAGHASFGKYSGAMKNSGITWNYEELDAYLTKPAKYIPKNAMLFNGLKKAKDRAALIEYLRLQADTPLPQLSAAMPDMEQAVDNDAGG